MKNEKFIAARKRKHWTHEYIAGKIGVSVLTLSRLENEKQKPRDSTIHLLCDLFCMSACDLGFERENEQSVPGEDDMNEQRRKLLTELFGIAAGATLVPIAGSEVWERFSRPRVDETTLNKFQQITDACWELSAGTDLSTAENVIKGYLPRAITIANTEHHPAAASIASQGLQLTSILVAHKLDLSAKIALCQQAVIYGRISDDPNVYVAALIQLAVAYQYANMPQKALQTYQEALQYSNTSPLLRARTLVEGGEALARSGGSKQDALRYLGMGYEVFPEQPQNDPARLYADCGTHTLILYEGLTRLDINQPKEALHALSQIEKVPSNIIIPERIRLEIINHQARAAVAAGDMGKGIATLQAAVTGAIALDSKKRYSEAKDAYNEMLVKWPKEQQVKQLAGLFQQA